MENEVFEEILRLIEGTWILEFEGILVTSVILVRMEFEVSLMESDGHFGSSNSIQCAIAYGNPLG